MKDKNKTELEDKILRAIKSGEIKMRPKWHFLLKSTLLVLGGVLIFLLLLYTTSFILFTLHRNGSWFITAFGASGVGELIRTLPWLLILVTILFIILLEMVLRKYSFAYKKPLIYSILGVCLLGVVGGVLLFETPLHENYSEALYHRIAPDNLENVHLCTVTDATEDGFGCMDDAHETLDVTILPETKFPMGTDIAPSDKVVVFGKESSSSVEALGVRKIYDKKALKKARRPFRMRFMH